MSGQLLKTCFAIVMLPKELLRSLLPMQVTLGKVFHFVEWQYNMS